MNAYLTERYGNPCRGCGYTWSTDADVCRGMIEESPGRVAALLEGRDGSENLPVLEWNARAYVAHMADNLRIWSERLAAVVLDPSALVTPYEEGDLARARGYQSLPLQGVLWSLGRALEDWRVAEALAGSGSIVLRHPEQGRLELHEVRCVLAHEANHHTLDISSANLLALARALMYCFTLCAGSSWRPRHERSLCRATRVEDPPPSAVRHPAAFTGHVDAHVATDSGPTCAVLSTVSWTQARAVLAVDRRGPWWQ